MHDAEGRPVPTHDNPPHMWLVTPKGYLCCLCLQFWQQTTPYDPCFYAKDYAKVAIKQAEEASGILIGSLFAAEHQE